MFCYCFSKVQSVGKLFAGAVSEGNEAVDDKDTPLAKGEVSDYLPMVAVGVGGVILASLIAYLVWKKRKEKEVESN